MDKLQAILATATILSCPAQVTYTAPPVLVEAEVEVPQSDVVLPQELKEICGCESNWNPHSEPSQFDATGLPLENKNYDGEGNHWSSDWGACQLNDFYWDDDALRLGLDYKNDKNDNYRLALHILEVQGIGAWGPSGRCHGKL